MVFPLSSTIAAGLDTIMPLSDTIRNAKPEPKAYKPTDEKGMYLYVTPSAGKLWRVQLLVLGQYPEVGLKEARERRDEARKLPANGGVDPAAIEKAQKAVKQARAANTFEAVAGRWFAV
jgi:hypothetical protein